MPSITEKEMKSLNRGDIVTNLASGNSYVIIARNGDIIIAIREVTISNPVEWMLYSKNRLNEEKD